MPPAQEEKNPSSISAEDRERFRELFDKLDVNKDGRIELDELTKGLNALHVPNSQQQAKKMMKKVDTNENQELDFEEFLHHMEQHERQLRLAFSDLDRDQDGRIDPSEIRAAFGKLGLNIDMAEANSLTKRIDKDGNLSIDWEEWRDFFQLYPEAEIEELVDYWRAAVVSIWWLTWHSSIDKDGSLTVEWEEWRKFFALYPTGDLEDMIQFWRQSLMIDIGDSLTCPPEFTKKEKRSGMWWRHLVAGGMAGVVSRSCTAPLDRVKIMLQVHGAGANMGVVSGIKQMVKEGGIKSLWRGNGTNVIKIAPESAIKFAAYEQLKKVFKADPNREVNVIERFAAGSTAGAFAQTCIYPLEVIKTKLAVGKSGQYKGILDCGIKVVQASGFKALYRGYIPNLVGIIPYAGIDLTIYETLKQMYMRQNPQQKDPGVLLLLACGTVSSTCGQLASYPFALVRTRLQAGTSGQTSMIPLAKDILLNEGPKGLYRGIAPNFLKVLPAVSISYVIYEKCKKQLGISK